MYSKRKMWPKTRACNILLNRQRRRIEPGRWLWLDRCNFKSNTWLTRRYRPFHWRNGIIKRNNPATILQVIWVTENKTSIEFAHAASDPRVCKAPCFSAQDTWKKPTPNPMINILRLVIIIYKDVNPPPNVLARCIKALISPCDVHWNKQLKTIFEVINIRIAQTWWRGKQSLQ